MIRYDLGEERFIYKGTDKMVGMIDANTYFFHKMKPGKGRWVEVEPNMFEWKVNLPG